MEQVLYTQGRVFVDQVPAPLVEPGTVLVEVHHSCISIGTEMSALRTSGVPLWKRALKQPHLLRKAVQFAGRQGLGETRRFLREKAEAIHAIGYSAAGTVTEVGPDVFDFQPGDRVACAGNQCAHHAEVIRVPVNLAARLPEGLDTPQGSTVALGAIAMQGVRRAEPTLGETFVVIGLGILGQLTAQILRANGCRVIGIDVDRARIETALRLGAQAGVHPDDGIDVDQVVRLTGGIGADGVIITAATPSNAVISSAFGMCRRKGRVVLVGDVGLNLNRTEMYEKELDFRISTSYGPGRYDAGYEEHGLDYPVGYVRWTENRNMEEYLRLLAESRVSIAPLISAVHAVSKAALAYEELKTGSSRPLMVLLEYPAAEVRSSHTCAAFGGTWPRRPTSRVTTNGASSKILNPKARPAGAGAIGIAVIGPGAFARQTHLPNLHALKDRYHIRAIAGRTGHAAAIVSRQYGAAYATTDYRQVLEDAEVDAVLIATRPNQHAEMVVEALRAGKHVLAEKPLALTQEELDAISGFYASHREAETPPVLLTGFNRRFSPMVRHIGELIRSRTNPMIINYLMNAGHIPLDHWTHGEPGGGRNRNEACHIYDLFTYLTGSRFVNLSVQRITPATGHYGPRDNFVASISFEDGSVATLTYTALGSSDHPKEQMQVFFDGKVIVLDDYRRLSLAGARGNGLKKLVPDKGHKAELELFAQTIQHGGEWPIPLWQQLQATEIALRVEERLVARKGTATAGGAGEW